MRAVNEEVAKGIELKLCVVLGVTKGQQVYLLSLPPCLRVRERFDCRNVQMRGGVVAGVSCVGRKLV